MDSVDEILELWRERGGSNYGGEAVTQLEHALQAAMFARDAGAGDELIAAALLHDVGHVLHDLPDDAADRGIDDRHEIAGGNWLSHRFGPGVTEPVRLHVAAKRFLCATEPAYFATLSEPSVTSLRLQGGPMTPAEVEAFRANPFHADAVRLRRWDDEAKIPDLKTPALEEFRPHLEASLRRGRGLEPMGDGRG